VDLVTISVGLSRARQWVEWSNFVDILHGQSITGPEYSDYMDHDQIS